MKQCIQIILGIVMLFLMGCQHTIRYSGPKEYEVPLDSTIRPTGEPLYRMEMSNVPDANNTGAWNGELIVALQSTTPSVQDVRIEKRRERQYAEWNFVKAIFARTLYMPFEMIAKFTFLSKEIHDHNGDGEIGPLDYCYDWVSIINYFEAYAWLDGFGYKRSEMVTVDSRIEQRSLEVTKRAEGEDIVATLRADKVEKQVLMKTDTNGCAYFNLSPYLTSIITQPAVVEFKMKPPTKGVAASENIGAFDIIEYARRTLGEKEIHALSRQRQLVVIDAYTKRAHQLQTKGESLDALSVSEKVFALFPSDPTTQQSIADSFNAHMSALSHKPAEAFILGDRLIQIVAGLQTGSNTSLHRALREEAGSRLLAIAAREAVIDRGMYSFSGRNDDDKEAQKQQKIECLDRIKKLLALGVNPNRFHIEGFTNRIIESGRSTEGGVVRISISDTSAKEGTIVDAKAGGKSILALAEGEDSQSLAELLRANGAK